MKFNIAQVTGLNTDQKAAQAVSETRDDTVFLALLELCSDDAFTKGRQALTELEDFFFEYEGTPAQKLTAASEEASNKFADSEFSLILAAISGKVLYIIARGEVQAYLKRGDKLSPLVSDTSASQLISGFISAGDRMFFAAKSLIGFLAGDLEKSVSLPIETFEEELESKIGGSNLENEGMAALSVEAYEEEVEIPSVPEEDKASAAVSQSGQSQNVFGEEVSYGGNLAQGKFRIKNAVIPAFLKTLKLFSKSKALIPKSGRGRLILGVALLVIVAVGVVFQYQQAKTKEKNILFSSAMSSAGANFEAAKGLASLNPVESKAKLDLALGDISKALAVKPKSTEAQTLKKQIEDETPNILRQSQVSAFPEFLDMELIKKGFKADKMSLNSGKLLLLDPAAKTLAMVDLAKKSNEILAGESHLGDATFASVNGGLAFVYSNNKGIIRVDSKNSKASSVSKTDAEWGAISDIYAFAGNLYVLDSGKNQIWKYVPASDGYSDKRAYLGKNTSADFAGALRMQIESSVYVLKAGGEMLRFTKGDKDTFSYSGLPSGVKDPKSFFVSSDTDDLYLLDSGSSRLLILTKTGSYKGEIKGDKFASASDLVVDEAAKKVYLLEGSKIYAVDLK